MGKADHKKAMLPTSLALFTLLNTVLCDCTFSGADAFSPYILSPCKNNSLLQIVQNSLIHASIYLIIHSTLEPILSYAFPDLLLGR